jgi:hypothetical protein
MEEIFELILDSLRNGDFLETDGKMCWLVSDRKYHMIPTHVLKRLVSEKLIYGKRCDDETTLYYISVKSEKALQQKKVQAIKDFLNF